MTERPTRADVAVRGLARLMRRTGSGAVSATEHARGGARLLATLEGNQGAARPRPWWVGAAVGAALAVVVLLLVPLVARAPESLLAFTIDGAPPGQSYIQAGPSGAAAHFSEGTVVTLAPSTRGRVAVTAHGARISVESGSAHFEVVHRPFAEWLVEAGPFVITVTGTSFDLGWNGAELEVVMRSGSVIVRGPPAREGIALRAGQRLVADAARVEVALLADPIAASAAPNSTAIASSLAPAPPPRPSALSWRARVASGDFAGVIAEAEARGLDASIDGSPLADLGALADAARYAGRGDLAQRALIAERTRFPDSPEARSAAFLLGRMTETSSPGSAITWYDHYLAEAPGGSLAAEALGRKMLAIKASSGRDSARPIAEEYQRRFPQGGFAAAATEILHDP